MIGYGSRRRSRWANGAAGASGSGASAGLTVNRTRTLESALYQSVVAADPMHPAG